VGASGLGNGSVYVDIPDRSRCARTGVAIPPLIRKTLDDKNPDMRVLAIHGLEQLDAKEALPKLRTLLDDNEKIHFDGLIRVSAAAREAISKLEGRNAPD